MAIQYDTDEERKLHLRTIHSIADQYHLDEAMIRDLYESKLEGLMNGARVKTYLSVLAARHVKRKRDWNGWCNSETVCIVYAV